MYNPYEKESYWIGDTIFSRHDGINYPSGVKIISSVRIQTDGGQKFIQNIIDKYYEKTDKYRVYTNKAAVVIGEVNAIEDNAGDKIVAWSYDGIFLVIQVVKGLP